MKNYFTSFLALVAVLLMAAPPVHAAITIQAYALNPDGEGMTTRVYSGESFTNDTKFPNIVIAPSVQKATLSGTTLTLTSDKGVNENISLNSNNYANGWATTVTMQVNDAEITKSGVYTLEIPAGFFTLNGETNEKTVLTWTYTNTNDLGDDEEEKLTLKSFTIKGVDMLGESPALDFVTSGSPVKISIDPIPEAEMLALNITDADGNSIRKMEIYNMPSNSSVVVDKEKGTYNTVVFGKAVTKFFKGTEYTATLTAYSTTNAANPANKSWGPVEIKFTGASEAYKYSDAEIVEVTPKDGTDVVDVTTAIVVTFSKPVAIVSCKATQGGQGAAQKNISDITYNEDKTVWTINPGSDFWSSSKDDWTFMISAKDAEGLVVKGTNGQEATSYYALNLPCFLGRPYVEVTPGAGQLKELYEFSIEDSRGIGLSYLYTPYVINEKGEKVTSVDTNSQVQYDKNGKVISADYVGDAKAVKSVFNLKDKITAPGKYTLVVQSAAFAIGTEYNADYNRYMEIAYEVVDALDYDVNVELVNFGAASFKVNEGRDVVVSLTPADDWKLATLTLNGKDVTAEVVDNAYTLAKVEAKSNLVATYEFAQDVEIVETTGIVSVENHDYTISSTAEGIKIENLNAGDNVKVYTANGMAVAQMTATKDTMTIAAPQGQIYVVKINDAAVKVKL